MFCAIALHHGTHFEPRISAAGYVALTTDIPSSTEKGCLFFGFIADKSEEGKHLLNPKQLYTRLHCQA